MTKHTKNIRWAEPPKIGFAEALYLPAIAQGIATTVKHLIGGKTMTRQYPEVGTQYSAQLPRRASPQSR